MANNGNTNDVTVFLGNGDGTFQDGVSYPAGAGPFYMTVADLTGSGVQDLLVADSNSGTSGVISVLMGNGDGTFQPAQTFAAGNAPRSIAVGDFDGDGTLDLAVGNYTGNNISILFGNGDGTFGAPHNIATMNGPYQVLALDVNGDGILDLVTSGDGGLQVLLGNGDGTFLAAPYTYLAGASPRPVVAADFNGDGFPDLAVPDSGASTVAILINDGSMLPHPGATSHGRAKPYHRTTPARAEEAVRLAAVTVQARADHETVSMPESASQPVPAWPDQALVALAATPGQTDRRSSAGANPMPVRRDETDLVQLDQLFVDLNPRAEFGD